MNRTGWIIAGVLLAIVLVLPTFLDPQGYNMRVVTQVFLFAAMGQAWNFIGGLGNQVSLGHAAFFGVGAYTSTILQIDYELTPWIGMFIGAILATGLALLVSFPVLRLRGHYFALATLAVGEVCRIIAISWREVTGGPVGISVPYYGDDLSMMQFNDTTPYYYIMLAALVIVSIAFVIVKNGRLGYFLRALRENQDAAEVAGVNTFRVKLIVMLISAFIMALLGTLYAQFLYFFDPDSVFSLVNISVRVALLCIVGGLGIVWGPIIGAAFLIPLQEFINTNFGASTAGVSQILYGAILIIVILVSPRGLLSLAERWRRNRGVTQRA